MRDHKKSTRWMIGFGALTCIALIICCPSGLLSGKSLSGPLGVSVNMAVMEHNKLPRSDGNFVAVDYDVLRVSRSRGQTTVYAWVLYEEYGYDGKEIYQEQAGHIPTVITFDTAELGERSSYNVIEYWEPRDGSYYADDIRAKFPIGLWRKAFDVSGVGRQKENCLKQAEEYFLQ